MIYPFRRKSPRVVQLLQWGGWRKAKGKWDTAGCSILLDVWTYLDIDHHLLLHSVLWKNSVNVIFGKTMVLHVYGQYCLLQIRGSRNQLIIWIFFRDNVRAGFDGCFFWCISYKDHLPGQLQRIRNFNPISLAVEWWEFENMLLFSLHGNIIRLFNTPTWWDNFLYFIEG